MSDKFTILTPTGDRPETFELCKIYVKRQTVLPSQWIVIDDGKISLNLKNEIIPFVTYIRREPKSDDPKHTLSVQMLEVFKQVWYDKIIMMEDDDWYAPNYCEYILPLLDKYDLVGLKPAIIYKITEKKYAVRDNVICWNVTSFKSRILDKVNQMITKNLTKPCFDIEFWKKIEVNKATFLTKLPLCIGMKGLPGRLGIGMGHGFCPPCFRTDSDCSFLKKCIGEDINLYKKWLNNNE